MTTLQAAERTLTCSDSVVCAELDGESVLLNVETGIYFGLDTLGTRIWTLLSAGATETQLTDTLLEEYDTTRSQLEKDLATFLGTLHAKALIAASD